MRKSYPSYSLVTLAGLFLAGSCSIIAEVDRTKIPQDDGPPSDGGQGTGGTSTGGTGTGGTSTGGTSGTGTGGAGGEPGGMGGEAGEATGGTSTGGTSTGGTGPGGMGGEGGTGALCGDGTIDSGEVCDDDNEMDGDGCDSDCNEEAGWDCVGTTLSTCTPICGDGIDVGAAEVCDDGNTLACGTCAGNAAGTNPGCAAIVVPAAATGTIAAVGNADLVDGETLVIGDGSSSVTFEFDNDAAVMTGRTAITYTGADDAVAVATAIATAINGIGSTFGITALTATTSVGLTNDTLTALGNVTITETVANTGFIVTGMSGGRGRNCPQTTGCTVDEACSSGSCNSSNQCTN